jgi:NDP-sugar pyrophosphorylase family protein
LRPPEAASPTLPKLLVPIVVDGTHTTPLANALTQLGGLGFRSIALLTGAHPDACAPAIERQAQRLDVAVDLRIVRETDELGTAGAVANALQGCTVSTVVVVPADTLFPFRHLTAVLEAHHQGSDDLTWVVTSRPGELAQNANRVWVAKATGRVRRTYEGVARGEVPEVVPPNLTRVTSAGVVITRADSFRSLYRAFLESGPPPLPHDLYRSAIPWAVGAGLRVASYDIRSPAVDLGTPERMAHFGGTQPRQQLGQLGRGA